MSAGEPAASRGWQPIRRRWQAWLERLPRSDTFTLTQRNVYILPTRAGAMFAVTLTTLLLASINYQLSLGYLLTFLLAGSGIVSMHLTHNTLRGLALHLRPPAPVFAGEAAMLDLVLTSPDSLRYGIGLRLQEAAPATATWIDVPAGGQAGARVAFSPQRRGLHRLPAIIVETRFPLGLFRAWTVWRPASSLLAYPALETPAAALPPAQPAAGAGERARLQHGAEPDGVRSYRRGDSPNQVLWKKAAKALAGGGELVTRDSAATARVQLWLDWADCGALPPEERLSRLAAWCVQADRLGASWGLRLPRLELPPGQGESQRRATLEALALWSA